MKKRKLLLALVAGFALSSCSIQDLMFWKKKDNQQQQDDSSSTDPAKATEWSTSVQNLMKQNLDGVVLPFISGTWTWAYDSEYKCVYGTSYDANVAEAKGVFSSWEEEGEDSYGDMWYKKLTTNGFVELCPYQETDDSNKSYVEIDAYFRQQQPDWTDADKAVMTSFLGFEVPFVTGYWPDGLAYYEDDDVVYGEGENVIMTQAEAILLADGYSISYDYFENVIATKIVGDYKVTVSVSDWSWIGAGCSIEISKLEKVTDWPTDDVATAAGVYMDFDPEVVPQPVGATGYFVSEGSDGLLIDAIGTTSSAYIELLESELWTINSDYLEDGYYICLSPHETVLVYITSGLSYLEIEICPSVPKLNSWPTAYVDAFTFDRLDSMYKVPAFAGEYFYYQEGATDESGETFEAEIDIYKESTSEEDLVAYKDSLISAGYTLVKYQEENDQYYANFTATKGKISVHGVYWNKPNTTYYYEIDISGIEADESPLVVENTQVDLLEGYSAQINASLLPGFEGTITYQSKDTSVATVSSSGEVTAVSKGTAEVEVSVVVLGKTFKETVNIAVLEQATSVSISGADVAKKGKTSQYSVSFPEGTTSMETPVWSLTSGTEYASIDSATGLLTVSNELVAEQTATIHLVVGSLSADKTVTLKPVSEVTDSITLAKLFSTSIGTTYTDFSGKKDASDAVYAGQCAGGNDAIQIRSKNSNSGIYSSTSGGRIVSVTLHFSSADTQSSGVKIVASNTAFSSTSDLFSATVVATLTKDNPSYEFVDSYQYVGVISAGGAHYFDSIDFVWEA